MKGSDIIFEVSLDLNDQEHGYEYTRWSKTQLESYMREAVVQAARYDRSLFQERVIAKVEPGGNWQSVCDCTRIVRIYGETDAKGNLKRNLRRIDDAEQDIWPGSPYNTCTSLNDPYVMDGYSINSSDGGETFKIVPPVPEHETRYVSLLCYTTPDVDSTSDVPDEFVAVVKQWMLYRALVVDSENNSAIAQIANQHKENFFAMLKELHELALEEELRYGSVRVKPDHSDK